MRIFIAGGAGFVGSNLAINFKINYPDYEIYCLDNLKRRGSELNLTRLKDHGVNFIHGDLRVKTDLLNLPQADLIIDAAAEPSVLAGFSGDLDYLIRTNFNGTANLLELAKAWSARFIFLSTSRVYPIDLLSKIKYQENESRFALSDNQELSGVSNRGVAENFPINGSRSFYGSSKLASELFVEEYNQLLGLETIINRCGVITGPYQMGKIDQGVIVLWMAKHFWRKELAYIGFGGTGKQVRDILHIQDLYRLIDIQVHQFERFNGTMVNAGGGNDSSVSLQELTALCKEITGNEIKISSIEETRTADIPIYLTDNKKVTDLSGWKPSIPVESTMTEIFQWINENEDFLKPILS